MFIEDGSIGNGLGNEGDRLILTNGSGKVIDEISYGSDTTVNASWMKKVGEGHSMERQPAGGSFIDNSEPTPGFGLLPAMPTPELTPSPTHVPTLTPTPTSTSTPTPEATLSPTPTATATLSPTPEPTATQGPIPTLTLTPTLTPIPAPIPTITPAPTPESTPSPMPTPTPEPTATPSGTVASRGDVLINEVQYNPPQSGTDTAYEWFELYNNCTETIELVGWGIKDNGGYDVIPSMNISAHGFAVLAATDNFSMNFPDYSGAIVFVTDGRIGNGLSNDGDYLVLTDSKGDIIDSLSYGSDTSINTSWIKKVGEGHSMERQPAGSEFIDNSVPTPGRGLSQPTLTPVPTSTATPSLVPNPTTTPMPSASPSPTNMPLGTLANRGAILINEVQSNPLQSGSDASYEWIELYNPSAEAIDLIGWGISDNYEMDGIPLLNVPADGFAVVAASDNFSVNFPNYNGTIVFTADGRIGNGLGNTEDHLILKDSAGTIIDEMSYGDDESITSPSNPNVAEGHSLERAPCGGQFIDNDLPTPGSCLPICNATLVPTLTPMPTPTPVSVLTQILPESNSSDAINLVPSHSISLSRPISSMAHKSSSTDQPVESPSMPLRSLLITLSSALIVILAWTLYRRMAR